MDALLIAGLVVYLLGMAQLTSTYSIQDGGIVRELYGFLVAILYIGVVAGCILIYVLTAPIVAEYRYRKTLRKHKESE